MKDVVYIPLRKTVEDFKEWLEESALTGKSEISPADIMQKLNSEPVYNVNVVAREVTQALIADNMDTNCITGDDTEHVVVTRAKLNQVLEIIRNGGLEDAKRQRKTRCDSGSF